VFHNTDLVEYPHGPAEDGLARRIEEETFGSVMAFARSGNPSNPAVPDWLPCEPGRERTMVFDRNTRLLENFDHGLMEAYPAYAEEINRRMFEAAGQIQH